MALTPPFWEGEARNHNLSKHQKGCGSHLFTQAMNWVRPSELVWPGKYLYRQVFFAGVERRSVGTSAICSATE